MRKRRKGRLVREECHRGNILVATLKEPSIRIFGGGEMRGARLPERGLVLDLARILPTKPPFEVVGWKAPRLSAYPNDFDKFVSIQWPDGGVPFLGALFWDALLRDIEDLAKQEGGLDLLVMCLGGHGRTGTALAILCSLWNLIPWSEDPVLWIRRRYCKHAVETEKQLQYIEKITGRETIAPPSKERRIWVYDLSKDGKGFGIDWEVF